MVTIKFHKTLQKYTGVTEHTFNVDTFSSLLLGLKNLFPELETFSRLQKSGSEFTVLIFNKQIISDSWLVKDSIPEHVVELNLVPSLVGSGRGGRILAGVAIAAFAFYALPALVGAGSFSALAGSGTLLGHAAQGLLGIGINLVLGALLQQELKAPQLNLPTVDPGRRNNDIFDGLTNTIDSGQMVSLNYGHIRVAGQFVSGYTKTINHGKDDFVSVADQF